MGFRVGHMAPGGASRDRVTNTLFLSLRTQSLYLTHPACQVYKSQGKSNHYWITWTQYPGPMANNGAKMEHLWDLQDKVLTSQRERNEVFTLPFSLNDVIPKYTMGFSHQLPGRNYIRQRKKVLQFSSDNLFWMGYTCRCNK